MEIRATQCTIFNMTKDQRHTDQGGAHNTASEETLGGSCNNHSTTTTGLRLPSPLPLLTPLPIPHANQEARERERERERPLHRRDQDTRLATPTINFPLRGKCYGSVKAKRVTKITTLDR